MMLSELRHEELLEVVILTLESVLIKVPIHVLQIENLLVDLLLLTLVM